MTSYKAHTAKIMLGVMIMFMAISLVSALDFDNVKSYDEGTKTITITNAFGLGEDIATIRLDTALNEKVGVGYVKVFEFTINTYGDYDNALKEIEYFNAKNMQEKEIDLDLKYKTIEIKEIENEKCVWDEKQNKFISCVIEKFEIEEVVWVDYITKNMLEGEITIAGFTTTKQGDKIEFIPTWFGERLTEYAEWEASLNTGITGYFDFNEGTGTNAENLVNGAYNGTLIGSPPWSGGILGGALNFSNGDDYVAVYSNLGTSDAIGGSMAGWVYLPDTSTHGVFAHFGNASSGNGVGVGVGNTQTDNDANKYLGDYAYIGWEQTGDNIGTGWHHWALTLTDTAQAYYLDGVNVHNDTQALNDWAGNPNFFIGESQSLHTNNRDLQEGSLDEIGVWNRTLTPAEITMLYNGGAGITYTSSFDTAPTVTLNSPINGFNSSTSIIFNYTITDDNDVANFTFYIDDIANQTHNVAGNETNNITTLSFAEGNHNWSIKGIDDAGQETLSELRNFTIDTTYPTFNIITPTTTSYVVDTNPYVVDLNWSTTEINPSTCWFYNETSNANVTLTCGTNTSMSVNAGSHTWFVYANDSVGNFNSSAVTFSTNYVYENVSYTNPAVEAETDTISLNVTATSITDFNGTLYYNNTAQTTSYSDDGTVGIMSSSVALNDVGNLSMYWNYWLDGVNYNSSTYYQSVNGLQALAVTAGSCAAGLEKVREFNFASELNRTALLNMDIDYIFRMGVSNYSAKTTSGNINATTLTLCINATVSTTYNIGYGEIQYERTGHSDRRYYTFSNVQLINGTLINNTLYSLLAGTSTSFLFTVKDAGLAPYEGVYLSLNRWYPEIDEYKTVEMAKTDDKGQTVMKVEVEDTDYRVGVYYPNGTLIYLASPIRFVCIASPCSYSLIVPEGATDAFDNWDNLELDFSFNRTTNVYTLVYNDPSQDTSEIKLEVYKETGTGTSLVCSDSASSYTGILTCNISAYTGNFRAVAYRTASPEITLATLFASIKSTTLAGDNGLFVTLIIMILLVCIGVFSPILTVLLSILAFIPALAFGIIPLSIGLIFCAMGFIVIHFMKRGVGQ